MKTISKKDIENISTWYIDGWLNIDGRRTLLTRRHEFAYGDRPTLHRKDALVLLAGAGEDAAEALREADYDAKCVIEVESYGLIEGREVANRVKSFNI